MPTVGFLVAYAFNRHDLDTIMNAMTETDAEDGSTIELRGCDVFTFESDLIAIKDSYLKSP